MVLLSSLRASRLGVHQLTSMWSMEASEEELSFLYAIYKTLFNLFWMIKRYAIMHAVMVPYLFVVIYVI